MYKLYKKCKKKATSKEALKLLLLAWYGLHGNVPLCFSLPDGTLDETNWWKRTVERKPQTNKPSVKTTGISYKEIMFAYIHHDYVQP